MADRISSLSRLRGHSSRYKGPTGDSRSPEEIFAGMEARAQQYQEYASIVKAAMDRVMAEGKLMTPQGRVELVTKVFLAWNAEQKRRLGEGE